MPRGITKEFRPFWNPDFEKSQNIVVKVRE